MLCINVGIVTNTYMCMVWYMLLFSFAQQGGLGKAEYG